MWVILIMTSWQTKVNMMYKNTANGMLLQTKVKYIDFVQNNAE